MCIPSKDCQGPCKPILMGGRRVENVKKTHSAGEQVGRVKGWAL